MSLREKLKGTGVAIVTPFKNHEVDFEALGRLIDHLVSNGIEYIVSMGTTGEVPTLTKDEKRKIAAFTIEKVNSRVPCVIGIGGYNTKEVIETINDLDVEPFDAILSTSPYYNKPSQEGIYQHYKAISENSPKPVVIYNVPGRTGKNITAETTLRLAYDCEKIAGIKEASGDMVQGMHILRKRPDSFLFVSGDDHIALPLIACGGDGVISVIANSHPKDFSDLIRAALQYDFKKAQQLQYKLLEAIDLLFVENNPAGVKCFLAEMGLIKNELRLPNVPISESFHQKIKVFMKNYS